jgi:hypothetical protein
MIFIISLVVVCGFLAVMRIIGDTGEQVKGHGPGCPCVDCYGDYPPPY